MGNTIDATPFFSHLLNAAESSGIMPDIGIDNSLMKYSGLNAAAELEASVSQVLSKSPDYIGSLGSSLSAFNNVPNAVGLSALVISILLDIAIMSLVKNGNVDNTLGMMRRVFAEEKASGVRDSMEEYIKRLGMYLHQPTKALEETERLERQLSEQLTRLKNSMLHDNQMSSRSMKHWTNGAAFHLQMLIHAARLKMRNTTKRKAQLQIHVVSIISVIHRYQLDLDELLKLYKAYKKTTITIDNPRIIAYAPVIVFNYWIVEDYELKKETPLIHYDARNMLTSSEAYVDHMFVNGSLIKNLKNYFSDLKDNVKELILLNNDFNLQNVSNQHNRGKKG